MATAFAHEYEELHRLVDQLPLERVRALRAVALYLVEGVPDTRAKERSGGRRRKLSFAGIMDAEPDLASRSEEILREEFGRRPA